MSYAFVKMKRAGDAVKVGGISVPVVRREDLIAMKERAAADPARRRSKALRDQADIALLRGDVPEPDEGWQSISGPGGPVARLKLSIPDILRSVETRILQVRARGTLTLPSKIRERYALSEGDALTLIDLDGVIVLSPKIGVVPKLAGEIEKLRSAAGLSVEDLIAGVGEERQRYYAERLDGAG